MSPDGEEGDEVKPDQRGWEKKGGLKIQSAISDFCLQSPNGYSIHFDSQFQGNQGFNPPNLVARRF